MEKLKMILEQIHGEILRYGNSREIIKPLTRACEDLNWLQDSFLEERYLRYKITEKKTNIIELLTRMNTTNFIIISFKFITPLYIIVFTTKTRI